MAIEPARTERATDLIKEAEELLQRARTVLAGEPAPEPVQDPGARVMAEILNRGGSVSRQELYQIAASVGMDKRGLGGLFRQTGNTCLHEVAGGRILLTPYGAERAQRYINDTRPTYGEPQVNLAKVAEPSFAEDWDSPEDAIYDDA
jgi:hypothetical protein